MSFHTDCDSSSVMGGDRLPNQDADSADTSVGRQPSSCAFPVSSVRQFAVVPQTSVRSMANSNTDISMFPQPASPGTYEIKFLITPAASAAVREWACRHLQPDPHSSSESGYGYAVNSLYLDTPAFDVYHRGDGFRQNKYRLRRYGTESSVWMELKRKQDGQVHKRRTKVADNELLNQILSAPEASTEGCWFRHQLKQLQLRPACHVTYHRFACIGTSATGPIRLTIDSNLCCQSATDWSVPVAPLVTNPLLRNQEILELKFRESIPAAFRGLIEDLRLTITSFSKYRQGIEACIPLQTLISEINREKTAG